MTDSDSYLDDSMPQNQYVSDASTNIKAEDEAIDDPHELEDDDADVDVDVEDAAGLMDELFGSDDDEHTKASKKILSKEYNRSVPEGKKTSISTALDLSALPQPSDFEFCILRLPNVIGCDTEEFDEKSYVEPSTTSYDNYIRWRTHYDEAMGETFKESNTKLVYWKDGTKSLFIGKDCYDIDEQDLSGNRDYIYAKLENETNNTSYKLCHGKFIKRLNVKATSQKSYKILQKNLAKKHERTKGSKQLTAAQRRNNKAYKEQQKNQRKTRNKRKSNRKRSLRESFLEQGGHGDDSSDDDTRHRKRHKQSESESSEQSDDDDDDDYNDSDSDDEDDDLPIRNRLY